MTGLTTFPSETLAGDAVAPSEASLSLKKMPRSRLQHIEINLSGLLLVSSLATEDSVLGTVKRRAELVLLTEGKTSPPFREGGVASRRLWRLSAKVLGKHGEQFEKSSQQPVAAWLDILSRTLEPPVGDARRTGGVPATCELLWMRPSATMASSLCQKMLQMLILAKKTDPGSPGCSV